MTVIEPLPPQLSLHSHKLPIVETFHSVQGEGAWMGVNAFFIRLAGCDVGCPWCDTKISWSVKNHPQIVIADLVEAVKNANPAIVVITGGEPLMHDLSELTQQLKQTGLQDLRVHLETSGAYPLSGDFDWITLSPKQFKHPHPSIYPQVNELKVVVKDATDLSWAEENAAKVPVKALKYLQSEWNTGTSKDLVLDYVMQHREWRVSIQTHKLLGVR